MLFLQQFAPRYVSIRGKYKPVGIRFSYIENAIMELLRAEIERNICFHIEYSLEETFSCSLDFQFHPDEKLLCISNG